MLTRDTVARPPVEEKVAALPPRTAYASGARPAKLLMRKPIPPAFGPGEATSRRNSRASDIPPA
jgi:hypothetical protein